MKKIIFFCAFLLFCQNFLCFGQQKITLKTGKIPPLKTPNERLFLAGDFNNWDPANKAWELLSDQNGSYQLSKNLPKGIYSFKITRGSWQTVECGAQGKPIANRTVTIVGDTVVALNIEGWQDNFKAGERKHTASPQVHIVSEKFDIPQLGRERRVWIYLPADYQSSKKKYPVIYMQDGQNLFDAYTSSYGEWGIDEIMDKMPADKQCIIVGVDHGGDFRLTEYNPYDSKYGKGRGNDYVDFLAKTLKPYIDSHYRTKKDPRYTAVAGSSMGGLISYYAVLKYPKVFGSSGIFSPAFWIAPDMVGFAQQKHLPRSTRFYFVCGDAESESMVSDMKKMADIIRSKGIPERETPIIIIKGAGHNEKQWNGDFPGFYSWFLQMP